MICENSMGRYFLFLLFLFALSRYVQASGTEGDLSADPLTHRQTTAGAVIGLSDRHTGTHGWLGIPYAQPPVGHLRWKAPHRVMPWSGERKTLQYGSVCTQSKISRTEQLDPVVSYNGSEDCLYLNIWSPAFSPAEIPTGGDRLPVMVWVHGGGNLRGSGNDYDGSKLAGSQNVIVVTLNYRLGPFGWLSHPALREEGAVSAEDASGNYGTLDIIQSLRWVRDNISYFGGDPHRVTIFGESAGGSNVFSLLVSPKAADLFHRAIVQSGVPKMASTEEAEHFVDDPEPGHPQSSNELLLQLLQDDGLTEKRNDAKQRLNEMTAQRIADYLRGKTYEQLDRAYDRLARTYAEHHFDREKVYGRKLNSMPRNNASVPKLFDDGVVLSKDGFTRTVQKGSHNDVPVIFGTNRDESKLFQVLDKTYVEVRQGKRIIKNLPRYNWANEYVSKFWKAAGADELAMSITKHHKGPAFVYRFDWDNLPTDNGEDLSQLYGAAHAIELVFLFGRDKLPFSDQPATPEFKRLSAAMMSYWAEFAYNGNPGKGRQGNLPEWRAWNNTTAGGDKMLILDVPTDGGIRMSDDFVTKEIVLKQIANNPALSSEHRRCQVYRDVLLHPLTFLTQVDYQAVENGLCGKKSPRGSLPDARR